MNYYAPHKSSRAAWARSNRPKSQPVPQKPADPLRESRGRTREQMDEGRCYAGR